MFIVTQIAVEYTLQVGSNKPRADIVIWDKDAAEHSQGTVKLIIECKKETVDARNAKDGIAQLQSYNIFMAMVEKAGHDKRGNPLFKRDKEGNEILVPDTSNTLVLGKTGEGNRTVSHQQKKKVEDDQTPDVPDIFAQWKVREGLAW